MRSKWRRYEILLPQKFNDGRPVPNAWLGKATSEIIDHFGAASFERQKVEGRWRFKQVLYRDVLTRLVVDVRDTVANRAWLKKFKAKWKKQLEQIELYVVSYPIQRE